MTKIYIARIAKHKRNAEIPMTSLKAIHDCTAIIMPARWKEDPRCVNEEATARDFGKDIYYESKINIMRW